MEKAHHQFEEHVSEVKMRLFAPSLRELFAEGAIALAEVVAESAPAGAEAVEPVAVRARDIEALLVEWLNELVYRTEQSGRVYTTVQIDRLCETRLEATIGGALAGALKTPVKAATFHELQVVPVDGEEGWMASVVLDV
ncbi:MAG: archease [Deltaproteobacteria bacterium]|nr:archease [Deltaproteobacteria bacterium]